MLNSPANAIAGYIMLTIIFAGFAIFFAVKTNEDAKKGKIRSVKFIELIFLILMPVLGLWFYDLLVEGRPKQYDWKYYSAVIIIPIIVMMYFLSRSLKHAFNPLLKGITIGLLLAGIFIAIWMLIHFFYSVGAVGGFILFSGFWMFLFFAFPYYSLFTVIILLTVELGHLFGIYKVSENIIAHEE